MFLSRFKVMAPIGALGLVATVLCAPGARAQTSLPAVQIQSQSAGQLPSFEVVSVKAHPHGYWPTYDRFEFTPEGFICRNYTAQDLLIYAYNLRDPKLQNRQRLIPGGQQWMFWDWFNIEARLSEKNIADMKALQGEQLEQYKRELVQSVLIDRFSLKVHHVNREAAGWELHLARNGPKNMQKAPENIRPRPFPIDMNHIQWRAAPISMLIDLLVDLEQAPVVDKTGLQGRYDFKLEFARDPDARMPPGVSLPATNDFEPSIFTALKEQLGLQLVPAKMSLDEIVIDHIEKPAPN
jgi:uncharacterized protein (TIGR03435 family)